MARANRAPEEQRGPVGLPLATDFRTVQGMGESLARKLGVKNENAAAARLADPAWIDAALASCSGKGLAILELLVEYGGALRNPALVAHARAGLGLAEAPLERVLSELTLRDLVMRLHLQGAHQFPAWTSLHAQSARTIAARLGGLSLPRPNPPASTRGIQSGDLRDRLARLAATAHLSIRANASGSCHMTSAKQYAKALGIEPDAAARMLDGAALEGLLANEGGRLVPALGALRSAVSDASAGWDELDAWARAHAPADRWLSLEALARAYARARHVEANLRKFEERGFLTVDPPELARVRSALAAAPSLEVLEHEGATFVRRAARDANATGDGHITPSFEIMLGPGCFPALALELALAAEPVRIDRVLTLKLTPGSVAAGCGLGLSADEILAALERVGRHGVPDNVRAMVLEWARGARVATARKVWMIECSSAEAAEAAARALGGSLVARPSATLVLASEALSSPAAILGKAGVSLRGGAAAAPPRERAKAPRSIEPLWTEPAPELVARFRDDAPARGAAHDKEDDEEDEDSLLDAPSMTLRRLAARAENAGPARSALLLAAELWIASEEAFISWSRGLPGDDASIAIPLASTTPLLFAELIALPPSARQRVLARSKSVTALVENAHREGSKGFTVQGDELVRSLRTRSVRDALGRDLGKTLQWIDEPAPASTAGEAAAPAAKPGPPKPADLATMPPEDVLAAFERAIASGSDLWLRVSSKSQGERAVHLRPERVLVRGNETTLLGTELETELGRSFPLPNVVAVRPAAG